MAKCIGCEFGEITMPRNSPPDQNGCPALCDFDCVKAPASCEACVAAKFAWQIGECQTHEVSPGNFCGVMDVGCFTDKEGCAAAAAEAAAEEACGTPQDCKSCIEADPLCMWMGDYCMMGANYWGPPEGTATLLEECAPAATELTCGCTSGDCYNCDSGAKVPGVYPDACKSVASPADCPLGYP